MFGIGMPELLIILAIALIVIGPKKLPDLAKSLGRALNEFKKATREFKDSLDIDDDVKTVKQPFNEISEDLRGALTDPPKKKKDTDQPSHDKESKEEASPAEKPDQTADKNASGSGVRTEHLKESGNKTDD